MAFRKVPDWLLVSRMKNSLFSDQISACLRETTLLLKPMKSASTASEASGCGVEVQHLSRVAMSKA